MVIIVKGALGEVLGNLSQVDIIVNRREVKRESIIPLLKYILGTHLF